MNWKDQTLTPNPDTIYRNPFYDTTGGPVVIEIPPASEFLSPILEVVPLQLLAYHIAVRRGCDVDQPRNLAKSVTVE